MEYYVSLKNPFAQDQVVAQLSGATSGGMLTFGSTWSNGASNATFRLSALPEPAPTFSVAPPSAFSLMAGATFENADYALYFTSAKGGQDVDYYVINSKTLVYDRKLNWAYWDVDKLEVTADQLKAICPPASLADINKHIQHINAAMQKYEINTRLRQAHFLAQLSVESDHFRTAREYASGAAYEGRADLGNTQPGDGKRFRGRGLIQLTGRDAYAAYGRYIGKNVTDGTNMVLVEQEPYASDAAGWFWLIYKKAKNINARADRDDVAAVTRAVNGGSNGLAERRKYTASAKKAFGI